MISPEERQDFGDGFATVSPKDESPCKDYSICARAYNTLKDNEKVLSSSVLTTRIQLWGLNLDQKLCNPNGCPIHEVLATPNRSAGFLVNKILAGEV